MDNRIDDALGIADQVADATFDALIARLARNRSVVMHNGGSRRATPNEVIASNPEFFAKLREEARQAAAQKMGHIIRIVSAKDERIAQLEAMCRPTAVPAVAGQPILDTSLSPRATVLPGEQIPDMFADEPTVRGWRSLPDGIARGSQRPTPVKS